MGKVLIVAILLLQLSRALHATAPSECSVTDDASIFLQGKNVMSHRGWEDKEEPASTAAKPYKPTRGEIPKSAPHHEVWEDEPGHLRPIPDDDPADTKTQAKTQTKTKTQAKTKTQTKTKTKTQAKTK